MTATIYRDGAFADGRSDRLHKGVSILVVDDAIAWIRPSDDEGPLPAAAAGATVVDASGSTIVPGMVDCHSHLTLPGGARWIARIDDPPERLLAVAERNGRLMTSAGVRWARDVGAPRVADPVDGRLRALSLGVRDRWRGRAGFLEFGPRARGWIEPEPCPAIAPWRRSPQTSCYGWRWVSSTTAPTCSSSTWMDRSSGWRPGPATSWCRLWRRLMPEARR